MNKLATLVLCIIVLSGCMNTTKKLEDRIAELETELDDCQNGADRLLGQIKTHYSNGDFNKIESLYSQIAKRHRGSSEQIEAEAIFSKARSSMDSIKQVEEKAEEEQRIKETAKAEAAEKSRLAALRKLKRNVDDVSGITWYYQPYFTHYTNTNRTSLYIGSKPGTYPWLRLMMSYTGDDWIFFERAYLSYDGNTKEVIFDRYSESDRDNGSGGVWEWLEISPDTEMVRFLKKMAESPNAKMRLTGKYSKTRTLSDSERKGIREVIQGYEALMREQVPKYSIE